MNGQSQLGLIRHAPVDGPRGVIHDVDASADVRDAAALLRLRAQLPNPHVAISSPARRARETAAALGLAASQDPSFSEQDFGDWTGRTHEEIRRDSEAVYDEFWRAPASNRPPGGESFVEQIARVRGGIEALPAGEVILVAHAGRIRAAIAMALELSPERALRFVINPLSDAARSSRQRLARGCSQPRLRHKAPVALFQAHRQSRHDEFDLVGDFRDHLVRETRRVAKGARQRIVGHDAEPDFVGHEHDRTLLAGERIRETRCLSRPVAICMHQVGQPQRQAVDEASTAYIGFVERLHERQRGFPLDPRVGAPRMVQRDALAHFRVERFSSCDIDGLARKAARARFRSCALPRSRASRDEDDCHAGLLFEPCNNHQSRTITK
jgi:alpha-ribazole phosphatase